MGFRLQRRIKIAPGLNLNISKRGLGISAGPRGAKVSIGPSGGRASVGVPGTGMRYEVRSSSGSHKKAAPAPRSRTTAPGASAAAMPGAMQIGLFGKLLKPPYERAFIDGAQRLLRQDFEGAYAGFYQCLQLDPTCIDAHLASAMLLVNKHEYQSAEGCLEQVIGSAQRNFPLIQRYLGFSSVQFELCITEEVRSVLSLDLRGAYLMLAEIYQDADKIDSAVSLLEKAWQAGFQDAVFRLSLVELYNDLEKDDELISLAQGTENQDDVTLSTLFYLGQAMMRKGYYDAAADVLKSALTKRKGRNENLLLETRYMLARVYEEAGKKSMAKRQYEQVLAKDFDFRDVKERLDQFG